MAFATGIHPSRRSVCTCEIFPNIVDDSTSNYGLRKIESVRTSFAKRGEAVLEVKRKGEQRDWFYKRAEGWVIIKIREIISMGNKGL